MGLNGGTVWEERLSSCCRQPPSCPQTQGQCCPCIKEYPYFPRSENTHLTTALTNCSVRETLSHCSLGRSMCWQHSSGTSQRTGTGETHQLKLQYLSISQGEGLLFWRMADNDFSAVFSAPEILQIHTPEVALPVRSSRAGFEKSVLGSSTQHTNGCGVISTFPFPILHSETLQTHF